MGVRRPGLVAAAAARRPLRGGRERGRGREPSRAQECAAAVLDGPPPGRTSTWSLFGTALRRGGRERGRGGGGWPSDGRGRGLGRRVTARLLLGRMGGRSRQLPSPVGRKLDRLSKGGLVVARDSPPSGWTRLRPRERRTPFAGVDGSAADAVDGRASPGGRGRGLAWRPTVSHQGSERAVAAAQR